MRDPATSGLMAECLRRAGVRRAGVQPAAAARLPLALFAMCCDADAMFSRSDEDKIMRREARRFIWVLEAALAAQASGPEGGSAGDRAHTSSAEAEVALDSFAASYTRARRFHAAWSATVRDRALWHHSSGIWTHDGGHLFGRTSRRPSTSSSLPSWPSRRSWRRAR